MPIFGGSKSLPIPAILPRTCAKCGARLQWRPVTSFDAVIGLEKADHYKAECSCGEVHYRDGRGQVVEPAIVNLPPDTSDFANSPQGPQPYSGYMEFVKQERAKAEALKAAQAKKAAEAAGAAGGQSPAAQTSAPDPSPGEANAGGGEPPKPAPGEAEPTPQT